VRFPRSQAEEQGNRSAWPWLAGVIQQRVGEDEWQVAVVDREVAELEDVPTPPPDAPEEDLYWPLAFRDRSEVRLR
jgi:hypothetical protein